MDSSVLDFLAKVFPDRDSKDLVDLISIGDLALFNKRLRIVNNLEPSDEDYQTNIRDFIDNSFHKLGIEIKKCDLEKIDKNFKKDFKIEGVKNKELIKMTEILNSTWSELVRERNEVENTNLLFLKFPFIIAGGRFREMYYWDTYWSLKGLLVCNLKILAKDIINNFIDIINIHGFFPNGTRTYYMNRSQPPYYIQMLDLLYKDNQEFFGELVLNQGLLAAEKELEWFKNNKTIKIKVNGKEYELFRYHVKSNVPRPESHKEDLKSFEEASINGKIDKEEFFSNIATIAESGWDFSTRWRRNINDKTSYNINELIPVDLNAIMYKNYTIMAEFYQIKGDMISSTKFENKAVDLKEAINKVLWNPEYKIWNDFNFKTNKFNDKLFYFSNFTPMIYGIKAPDRVRTIDIISQHRNILFNYDGGIPVSSQHEFVSGEQWDFPNVWAPHVEMMVNFFNKNEMKVLALHCANSFICNSYNAYNIEQTFFEKYNFKKEGISGQGGEYKVQTGFGWTNGTLLEFINTFKDDIDVFFDHGKSLYKVDEFIKTQKASSINF